jgi:hypothetical protein
VSFSVVWLPAAEAGLASAWLASPDRAALTAAAAEIDARLAASGPAVGESRDGDNRITFERPLAVLFRADRAARTVSVIRAWEFR